MKIPRTNEYSTLNIFNYFMFLTNIGFLFYVYLANKETSIVVYEIIFLVFNYYRFVAPICIIILLFFIFQERKQYTVINSKTQKTVTTINLILLLLILLSFILFIVIVAYIAHGIDNCGKKMEDVSIINGGPDTIDTKFDLSDLPYLISENAGKYLCNYFNVN